MDGWHVEPVTMPWHKPCIPCACGSAHGRTSRSTPPPRSGDWCSQGSKGLRRIHLYRPVIVQGRSIQAGNRRRAMPRLFPAIVKLLACLQGAKPSLRSPTLLRLLAPLDPSFSGALSSGSRSHPRSYATPKAEEKRRQTAPPPALEKVVPPCYLCVVVPSDLHLLASPRRCSSPVGEPGSKRHCN